MTLKAYAIAGHCPECGEKGNYTIARGNFSDTETLICENSECCVGYFRDIFKDILESQETGSKNNCRCYPSRETAAIENWGEAIEILIAIKRTFDNVPNEHGLMHSDIKTFLAKIGELDNENGKE